MSKRAWPLCAVLMLSACAGYVEVPVETPLQSKIDVQRFRRALVAGFLVDTNGGELDLQAETVRLLENQLKTRTKLQVLEADRPPLQDAVEKSKDAQPGGSGASLTPEQTRVAGDRILQDTAFWRGIGEEFQSPLIVSGRMAFDVSSRSGFQSEEKIVNDPLTNAPHLVRGNRYMERKAYSLTADFYFVDGGTGGILHREKFSEEVIYGEDQKVSSLSAYFELMDRLLPNFLGIVSPQRIRGQRILLR
jgi:hypothetical protein